MSDLTIAERVQAGAAWLDENEPGWVERTDAGRLDMRSCSLCMLGQQREGGFFSSPLVRRKRSFEGVHKAAAPLGFQAYDISTSEYEDLRDEWRRLIAARRAVLDKAGA